MLNLTRAGLCWYKSALSNRVTTRFMWLQALKMCRQEVFPDFVGIGKAQQKAYLQAIFFNCGDMNNLVGQRWYKYSNSLHSLQNYQPF